MSNYCSSSNDPKIRTSFIASGAFRCIIGCPMFQGGRCTQKKIIAISKSSAFTYIVNHITSPCSVLHADIPQDVQCSMIR